MVIKKLCLAAIVILGILCLSPRLLAEPPENPGPTITLRVGQRYPLEGVLAQDAKITPETVATAHETPEGLLLVAHQPGVARLTLSTPEKSVSVRVLVRAAEAPQSQTAGNWDQTQLELRKLPGIRLGGLGDKLVVQGEILGRNAYQRILLYLRTYPKNLLVLALPAAGVRESLLEQASSALAAGGLDRVKVANAGHRYFLEGEVGAPEEIEKAFEIAQAVIPNIENHLAVPIRIEPTVLVRIFILELSRQAHQALGLSWPASTPHAALFTPGAVAFNPAWSVTLSHLSTNGEARVLAEPQLSIKSGAEAELSAGGEIPIRITGTFENKVVWKNYGLRVRVRIGGLAGRAIRTKIEAESSQLDEATAVDGVPGIRNTTLSTEVDAPEGQPILLTGLFQASTSKDVERVPGLGSLPLIGELFKSRRFREHESELLIALLPQLGAPAVKIPLSSLHGLDFDARWRVSD